MLSIHDKLTELRTGFELFSDPRDKYVLLVDMAKNTQGLSPELQIETNRIIGCTSQAWIIREKSGDRFTFFTDSDAMIVKGLLSLIEHVFNGHTKEEILGVDGAHFLQTVGLGGAISSQRTNGFSSAIRKIQTQLLN